MLPIFLNGNELFLIQPKSLCHQVQRSLHLIFSVALCSCLWADHPKKWLCATNQFTQHLIAYEEEKKMPYVTSAERIGIEKGKLEGRSEGLDIGQLNEAREMVLEALDTKFSSNVPADIRQVIKDLNNRVMLKKLLRSTIQSKDIDDFRKTLEELTAEDPA
jgi:hypothetical protein